MDLLLLIIAGIAVGLVYIISKKLALEKYHPATYTTAFSILGCLLAIPLLLYHFKIPTTINYWILAIISMLTYGLGNMFGFKAFKTIDASTVGLVSRLNLIVASFIGLLVLQESYSTSAYIGLFLILFGSLIVVFEKQRFKLKPGILFATFMAVGYGLAAVFDKKILDAFSPYTYVFINSFGVGLLFSLIYRQARLETWHLIKHKAKLLTTGVALNIASWTLFLIVLERGQVSKIYPMYDGIALMVTVFVGIFALKERDKLIQKILGSLSIISGIILLG